MCLYALGVGAPGDWLDQGELQFVYELSSQVFKALPTFAVLYPGKMIEVLMTGDLGGMKVTTALAHSTAPPGCGAPASAPTGSTGRSNQRRKRIIPGKARTPARP